MDDIAPKLIENVNKDFADNLAADKNVAALSEKLAAGQARYEDAYKYAESVGNARAKAFEDQISSEVLPEGKMHYNIASRLMTDSLTTDHEMIADYAAGVQKAYNEEAGINLKALKADVNEDRIDGFVERLSSEDVFDDVSWILQEPVVTHARSVVDDTIKKNAEFQGRAGIKATVIRNADPKCCKWCSDLAGDYVYPSVPREVFQRHDHCRCTVDYKGRRLSTYAVASNNIWGMRDSHTFRDLGEQDRIEKRASKASEIETRFHTQLLSPSITNLRNELIGRSVGAKFDNYDIMDLETGEMYHLAEGSKLQNKEVFAGKGSHNPYRDAWKYADKYGGNVEDWQHVKANGTLATRDGDFEAEVHWSQCEGIGKKEFFIKKWLE